MSILESVFLGVIAMLGIGIVICLVVIERMSTHYSKQLSELTSKIMSRDYREYAHLSSIENNVKKESGLEKKSPTRVDSIMGNKW